MNNLKMFCITLEPSHINYIKNLNYTPVLLGNKTSSNQYLSDKEGKIFLLNKYYGEYTFHYWLWKNYLNNVSENWIGFANIENTGHSTL